MRCYLVTGPGAKRYAATNADALIFASFGTDLENASIGNGADKFKKQPGFKEIC